MGESAARAKAAGAPEFRPFFLSSYLLHASVWLPSPSHSSPRTGRGHFPQVHSHRATRASRQVPRRSIDPLFAGYARQTEHCADAAGTSGQAAGDSAGDVRASSALQHPQLRAPLALATGTELVQHSQLEQIAAQRSARTYAIENDVGECFREMAPQWLRSGSDMFGCYGRTGPPRPAPTDAFHARRPGAAVPPPHDLASGEPARWMHIA